MKTRTLFERALCAVKIAGPIVWLLLANRSQGQTASEQEAREIARDAYIYAYPLVLMDVTRGQMVNYAEPSVVPPGVGPANRFSHIREFPDPQFKIVIRPNADTLYSSAWLDLKAEPIVLSVPAMNRYFVLPMLSMWTDVFASPGTRTTGRNQARTFVIAGPDWTGRTPEGMELIRSPTRYVWIIGRTQANGKADYENVHKIQDDYKIRPLSAWDKTDYTPPKGQVDPGVDMKTQPSKLVEKMDAATFFARFAEVLKDNPPNQMDYPMVHRLERVGIVPGKSFDLTAVAPAIQDAFERGEEDGKKMMTAAMQKASGDKGGQWTYLTGGAYGVDYVRRAAVARFGLGANLAEDAVYPSIDKDESGRPFDGSQSYILRFERGQLPPVNGFWSLTAYDANGYFIPNALQRQAIGDRDRLAPNPDGSLDIFVQGESPGKDRESNWLPVAKGPFNLLLRLYWPQQAVIAKSWTPPQVRLTVNGSPLMLPTGSPSGRPEPQPEK